MQHVNRRLQGAYSLVTDTSSMIPVQPVSPAASVVPSHSMKSFTVNLTTAVHDALVEACGIANRRSPDGPITLAEYTEELIINRVVELGLLRTKKVSR